MNTKYEPPVQLLLNIDSCRIVRNAIAEYIKKDTTTEYTKDLAWEILADLTKKMNNRRGSV